MSASDTTGSNGTIGPGPGPVTGPGVTFPLTNVSGAITAIVDAQPVAVPPLPSPLTSLGTLPQPTGLRDVLAARLGYTPLSSLSAANSAVASLQAALATAQGRVQSLTGSLVPAARSALAAAQNTLNGILVQVAQYQNTIIPNIESEIATLEAAIDTGGALSNLKATLADLKGQRTTLQGDVSALTSEITGLFGSFTSPIGSPSSVLSSDAASADGYAGSQDSYDPAFSGFAPATIGFEPDYGGLGASGPGAIGANGPQTAFAVLGLGPSAAGGGGPVATLLGYIPTSSVSSPLATVSALLASLGAANGSILSNGSLLAGLQNQTASLNAAGGPITTQNGILGALSARATDLQNEYAALQASSGTTGGLQQAEDTLSGDIASVTEDVSRLTTQRAGLLGGLQALQAGSFPVSFSWNFGDGATSGSEMPDHTYATPGAFQAYVTVTITVPATAVTSSKSFSAKLPPGFLTRLIGQWPDRDGVVIGPVNNGLFRVTVNDAAGNPIANTRFVATAKTWFRGGTTIPLTATPRIYTTNSEGYYGVQANDVAGQGLTSDTAFSIVIRSLRNPLAQNTASYGL